jgi:GNAT superfamily N-acetyltransferase
MLRLNRGPNPKRRDQLLTALRATNESRSPHLASLRGTPAENPSPLEVYALDAPGPDGEPGEAADAGAAGELLGGLAGHLRYGWLHIDLLWVAERARGSGLGARLVGDAEAEAVRRGCGRSRVETWDFQAPGFYRKLGYRIVSAVPDYPPGVTDYLLVKELHSNE